MRWLGSFFVDLLLNFSSVPVKKQKHLHQLIVFATFFVAGGVNFPPPFPVIIIFFPPGRDIPGTTSPTSLRHWIYQKHFHYNVYNNWNHVHGPHILSHFKELLLKGLPKIRKWQWWQKAIYSRPARVIFDAILFVYSLRDGLALRSCITRDGALCIKNVRFECFDGTNPITEKGVSYNLLQRLWVLFVSYCCFYASLVGYSYGIVCITWLNKRCVLLFNISSKQKKKTYNILSSDRAEKIPGGSCSILLVCSILQEWFR